jgi:hypothetical protein
VANDCTKDLTLRSLIAFRTESRSDLELRLRSAGLASDLIAGAFKLSLSRIAAMAAAWVETEVGSSRLASFSIEIADARPRANRQARSHPCAATKIEFVTATGNLFVTRSLHQQHLLHRTSHQWLPLDCQTSYGYGLRCSIRKSASPVRLVRPGHFSVNGVPDPGSIGSRLLHAHRVLRQNHVGFSTRLRSFQPKSANCSEVHYWVTGIRRSSDFARLPGQTGLRVGNAEAKGWTVARVRR